ncbi:MAG: hypothetical protein ISS56_19935 [Anaerolineae bacterium]|nr:hypothetical protein [Anaerolineae bacterium]
MRAFWNRTVREPVLRALIEVTWFGPVVSAVLVALLVNLLTEALTAWGGLWLGWGFVALLAVATMVFVYAYAAGESRRRGRGLGPIADRPNPPRAPGLIAMLSREETLREAIDHHRPELSHCWLLVTPEMQEQAARVVSHYPDLPFTLHALADRYDTQGCYRIVSGIYQDEAPRQGLDPRRVIADITGGTKPMALGMIVACLEGEYSIEHVPTVYDALQRPIGPLPPIQIVVQHLADDRPDQKNGENR